MQAELIVDARNAVGESPVWVPEENALYWVNIPNGGLQCWNCLLYTSPSPRDRG